MTKKITISKQDIEDAARQGAMAPRDVESLWQQLLAQKGKVGESEANSGFDFAQLAWYGGGVLVMIAMAWFMERAGSVFGTGSVFMLSLAYAVGFAALGHKLRFKDDQKTPGGLLFTLAVLMAPLAVVSGLEAIGIAARLSGSQVALFAEIATLGIALVAVNRVKVSILSAPVFGSLWLLSMTIADLLARPYLGPIFGFASNAYLLISMGIGVAILALAIATDSRFGREPGADYSWWGYFFGVAAFWIPLSMLDSGSELGKLAYFGINLLMMVGSVLLARKVFLLAGAIGSIYYIGHVLWTYFSDSLAFPLALIGVGIAVIYLGVQYRRRQASIEAYVLGLIPEGVRKHLPRD